MSQNEDGSEAAGPTPAGYVVGALLAIAIVAGIYFALTAGGNEDPGVAHIATPSSGDTNGVMPDERAGVTTAAFKSGGEDTAALAKAAGCRIEGDLEDEGNDHLQRGDEVPEYKTVPPTSGAHIGPPLQQADGAYIASPAPEDVVHSLEHGRIAVQYSPALPEESQLELKGMYDSAFSAALLFPNSDMPYAVAATAWTALIACPEYQGDRTLKAIAAWAAENFGQAPEPVDIFPPLTGPSFAEPGESAQEAR